MAGSDSEDIDDLLLEAAGASRPRTKRSRDASGDSDQDDASQLSEEVSQEYRAPARKAKGPGKKRKTEQGDDDELNKDDSIDEDAFVFDGYGKDLIRDSADRATLDNMTELDREYEFSQRAEARDREMERRRNVRMLQQARAPQGPSQQQQAAIDKAEQMRSSTRQKKQETGKKNAIAELRAAQERKTTQAKKKSKRGRGQESDEAYTDDEEEDISDVDSDDERNPSPSQGASGDDVSGASSMKDDNEERNRGNEPERFTSRAEPPGDMGDEVDANISEVQKIQIKRYKLEKWAYEPFFEKTVVGCIVRVAYSGKYHVAEVVEVQEREMGRHRDMGVGTNYPYHFGSGSTCRVLLIRRGESDRICPMTVVSNQSIDDQEMGSFMEYTKAQRMPLMTRAHVEKVAAALKTAENYTYTAEDVKQMLAEKKARGTARMNIATEKAKLVRIRDHAQEVGDDEEIERAETELAQIENRQANAERNANKRGFGMSNVNEKNKRINFLNAYQNVSSAPENQKVSATGADAFSRRKTQSKVYWSTIPKNKREELQAAAAAAGTTVQINEDGTALVMTAATGNMNLAGLEVPAAAVRTNADGDVVNLEIDISVLDAIPEGAIKARKLLGPQYGFTPSMHAVPADLDMKQLLTLSEYKRRTG
ncbi:hypothetical protein ABBQ32_004113 [Trebouxia sp. C0010 RCD-2024]